MFFPPTWWPAAPPTLGDGETPWTPEIVGASEAAYIASVRYCQQVAQFSLQQANRGFEGINKAWETAKNVGGWRWNMGRRR